MAKPREGETRYLLAGAYYRMAHVAWGEPDAPPIVCVHGLTRTGRDFDVLADALAQRFHVICPDLPGRGNSDWLPDTSLYEPNAYVTAISHLLAAINRPVTFLGTSLGGICGMMIAASIGQPIERMVLNDVGPFIPSPALRRIRDYMSVRQQFESLWALEAHVRAVHAPFGMLTDPQWAQLAETSARQMPNGKWALHYDPGIAAPIRRSIPVDVDLWFMWAKIHIPVLVVRGETSDLLLPRTLERMELSGASTLIIPNTGHAPALMDPASVGAVRSWLEGIWPPV